MDTAAEPPLLDSVLQDLVVIGAISTFVFVFALFRLGRATAVPAWWWLASAVILAIVAFMGTGISWGRGLAVILSGVAVGNGVRGVVELWKSGDLRPRPPQESEGDYAEDADWF